MVQQIFSLGQTPYPGVDPYSLVKFLEAASNWKNLPTQHAQMKCKSLAAAPFCCANRRTYSSIDTHPSSFLHIPSFSFSSSSFPPTFLSSILFLFLFFSILFFPVPSSLLSLLPPSPLLPPDTPLFCVAGVRMLRRDHPSLS